MANVGAVINSIRNIMRNESGGGISGDAQRLEQLGWMLFLKIIDDKDKELEMLRDNYISVIPEKFQWRNWALDKEGITGDELLKFIDSYEKGNEGLFEILKNLSNSANSKRASIVREVFESSNNYMKSGYGMRKVINKLNEIDFNNSEDKHIFGTIYESILIELRDAGNKGEFYTPRAVTQLMTLMTDPKLGDKVLDPAAGTGGFLTAAIDHVRENYVNTVDDEHILQKSITGWEYKPVPFVLGLTNLILHEIDVPDYHYMDSLKTEYNNISRKDQVDIILANPPFGASIAEGVESNFPLNYRTKESADLFLVLMLKLLKEKGKCAIVLPDGSITGDGIKARIREKLLNDSNLHTIIKLPKSTFFPATVDTNLLFFEKGSPTKEIWYYEHKLPKGQKSYSKTKSIQFEEFEPLIEWWHNRKETNNSWKVSIENLVNWDLIVPNPYEEAKKQINTANEFTKYENLNKDLKNLLSQILENLPNNKSDLFNNLLQNHKSTFYNKTFVSSLRQTILEQACRGNLSLNVSEESALNILNKIRKSRLSKLDKKGSKKFNDLSKISDEEIPFSLPVNWTWCRFGEIVDFDLGKTPASKQISYWGNGIYNWLSISDMSNYGYIKKTKKRITQKAVDEVFKTQNIVPIDTLLMSFKLTVGKVSINKIPLYHNEAIISIFPFDGVSKDFLFFLLPYITKLSVSKKVLMGQTFNSGSLSTMIVPLPPANEQAEIIEKVELLMKLCDKMEELVESRNSVENILSTAVLFESMKSNISEITLENANA
jgi:type I restriction enzyme M protein